MRVFTGLILLCIFSSCFENGKITKLNSEKNGYLGHGEGSLSQEILDEFAPPSVDGEIRGKIEKLLDINTPSPSYLTKDGKNLYFQWSITGTNQVYKMKKGGFPQQLTSGEDRASLVGVTPDEKYLIISRDEKGNEYTGLYLMDKKGGGLTTLVKKKKVQYFYQFTSKDSRFIYYSGNDCYENGFCIYKYDLKNKNHIKIFDEGVGSYSIADHFNDSKGTLLIQKTNGNSQIEYFLYTEEGKKLIPVLGQNEKLEYHAMFSLKKDKLIVLTNKLTDFKKIYEYDIKTRQFKQISKEVNADIAGFSIDDERKKLYYRINNQGYFSSVILRLKDYQTVYFPTELNGKKKTIYHEYAYPISGSDRYMAIASSPFNGPNFYSIYDFKKNKKTKWLKASVPEMETESSVVASLESYKSRDGVDIPLFVYRPPKCKAVSCPIILYYHGGPESQIIPRFSVIRELLLKEGFIWAEPNVRGSNGHGKRWLDADNGPKRLNVITDIEDAAIYIKKNWAVNGETPKVAAYGGSYGGYSVYMAMTKFSKSFDVGVSVVGMSNLVTFLNNTAAYRRENRIAEYGDPIKDKEALIKLSPMTYLEQMSKPLLIVHGAMDPRVPAGEAVQIYRTMERKGLDGKLILFPDEGHGVVRRKNRALYYSYVIDFLKKNLIEGH